MLAGLDVIKKGSKFIVGDGKTTRISQDNFVASHPPRPLNVVTPTLDTTVDTLISTHGSHRYWNVHLISQLVSPDDHRFVMNHHLSRTVHQDKLVWNYSPSGDYTVKFGYWFLFNDPTNIQVRPAVPYGSVKIKNKLWKLPIIPKIKYMLWRTISKALPTRSRLLTRGMDIDPHCPRCPTEEETINHVLFTCPYAASIWSLSNFPWLPEQRLAPFWLIWRLWRARNNLVFNKFNESCSRVVTQTEAEVNEWLQNVNRREEASDLTRSSHRANVRWKKPVFPLVKCNFNAGFTGNNTQRTGGWIIRDHAGLAKA
ncbi:putative reverse transcriptase zinc-binding domain-containing protein [Arabidopsis thaliana]